MITFKDENAFDKLLNLIKSIFSTKANKEQSVYYVKGTQTASTHKFTGVLSEVSELYDGLTINYWLPYAGNGTAVTLQLTLKGGTTTNEIPVYCTDTTRLTTHIAANNVITMVYHTVTIGSTSYSGWWVNKTRDDNTVSQLRYDATSVIAGTNGIHGYNLIALDSDNKWQGFVTSYSTETTKTINTSAKFKLPMNILYYNNGYSSANNLRTANYHLYSAISGVDTRYSHNYKTSFTVNKPLYLEGTIDDDGYFSVTETCITQTFTSGKYYVFLGIAGCNNTTYSMALFPNHSVYYCNNGKLIDYKLKLYGKKMSASGTSVSLENGLGEKISTITTQDTWRGIRNNLTSDSTTDSLSAAQGKVLKGLVDGKVNKRCQYTIQSSGTAPYKYVYLCRIGNSLKYSGVSLNLRYNARYIPETNVSIVIGTGEYAYNTSTIWALSDGSSTRNFYYVRTANDSSIGYDYYDIYADGDRWDTANYEINQIGGSGTLQFTHKGTLVDSLPSNYVQIGKKYADASHTHNYAGSSSAGGSATSAVKLQTPRTIALSGGATGTATSFDGSSNITIPVTAIQPNYIINGYTSSDFYLDTHPENFGVIIPFINNDIAYLTKRGGSVVVKYDDIVQSLDISNLFDGSPSYSYIQLNGTTTITIELALHRVFAWTNTFYIDFGTVSYRAKNIKFEVMNTNYANDVWTQKGIVTDNPYAEYKVRLAHTPVGASNAGAGFNKVRITLSNWYNSAQLRITAIGIINYNSYGLRETFLSKDGGSLYGGITPFTNNEFDLGSSSYKWANIYATKFIENGTALSSKYAAKSHTHSVTASVSNQCLTLTLNASSS